MSNSVLDLTTVWLEQTGASGEEITAVIHAWKHLTAVTPKPLLVRIPTMPNATAEHWERLWGPEKIPMFPDPVHFWSGLMSYRWGDSLPPRDPACPDIGHRPALAVWCVRALTRNMVAYKDFVRTEGQRYVVTEQQIDGMVHELITALPWLPREAIVETLRLCAMSGYGVKPLRKRLTETPQIIEACDVSVIKAFLLSTSPHSRELGVWLMAQRAAHSHQTPQEIVSDAVAPVSNGAEASAACEKTQSPPAITQVRPSKTR